MKFYPLDGSMCSHPVRTDRGIEQMPVMYDSAVDPECLKVLGMDDLDVKCLYVHPTATEIDRMTGKPVPAQFAMTFRRRDGRLVEDEEPHA